jgi:hypothetical protein
LLNCP